LSRCAFQAYRDLTFSFSFPFSTFFTVIEKDFIHVKIFLYDMKIFFALPQIIKKRNNLCKKKKNLFRPLDANDR